MVSVVENLQIVRKEIENSSNKRTVAKDAPVTLVAVTKNHGVEMMQQAIDAGVNNIGENRIQEAAEKFKSLNREVTRHLIGHLQTNKAKQAVRLFDLIHSLDSENLAEAINKAAFSIGKIQNVLIQVNLAKEDSKFGVYEENLGNLIATVDALKNLRLRGFMLIAPNFNDVENCRPLFRRMYEIFSEVGAARQNFDILSMGMTHDYKIAIEEGANVVRVGTAIFGERFY